MKFSDKKVLVFGTGISGIAASNLLNRAEAKVILFDGNKELDKERVMAEFAAGSCPELYVGELPESVIDSLDLVVLSPGVPTDIPMVLAFKEKNIPVIGEIELAYQCGKGDVLAITGTNGKTTTTALLGEIMKNNFENVHVVGNIGIPYTSLAVEDTDDTVTVAEISSFQLETIQDFCPKVSAVLNITPDHLNRHHTMENYIQAKLNISMNQSEDGVCVLNYEDDVLREKAADLNAKVIFFSSLTKLDNGFYLDGDTICMAVDGDVTPVIQTNELNILGRHNYENVMAATAMALSYGVPLEKIRETLKVFQAVEHRIEYVTEKRGIRFYNDSKGTNPDAAIKGIQAMDRPTFLIGGGYDKASEYDEWINAFDGKVRKLVLIGQTREKIAECAESLGFKDYCFAESLQEAVDICYKNAQSGDAILLSPACASFDMFTGYEERGKVFKEYAGFIK